VLELSKPGRKTRPGRRQGVRAILDVTAIDIPGILPHRYPFLLVDRILEIDQGKRIVGRKSVSYDEPFFSGHFPTRAIMPNVLIIEAITQVGAVLLLSGESGKGKLPYLTGIQQAQFWSPVVPGDVLTITVTITRLRGNAGWAKGEARVAEKLVCDMAFSFFITCI
jgi:3-hydroxyacyl-[acyl-carrier-protein] dehydratase